MHRQTRQPRFTKQVNRSGVGWNWTNAFINEPGLRASFKHNKNSLMSRNNKIMTRFPLERHEFDRLSGQCCSRESCVSRLGLRRYDKKAAKSALTMFSVLFGILLQSQHGISCCDLFWSRSFVVFGRQRFTAWECQKTFRSRSEFVVVTTSCDFCALGKHKQRILITRQLPVRFLWTRSPLRQCVLPYFRHQSR
jgi:hypothetical protein